MYVSYITFLVSFYFDFCVGDLLFYIFCTVRLYSILITHPFFFAVVVVVACMRTAYTYPGGGAGAVPVEQRAPRDRGGSVDAVPELAAAGDLRPP